MKRFLFMVFPALIFVFSLVCSCSSLSQLFYKESYKVKQTGIASDNVYASLDLGFVVEETSLITNFKNYLQDGVVVGECISVKGDINDINRICDKLGLNILKKYKVGDILMIEGVSPRIKYFLDDRQSNIQIAVNKNDITIGSPIIYGSY